MVWSVVFGIQGSDTAESRGNRSSVQVNIPDGTSQSDAVIFAQQAAELIDALIDGVIVSISLCLGVSLPGTLKSTPADVNDVQHKALFSFRTTNGFNTRVSLPTFKRALYAANSNSVDTADTDVAAFLAAMTSGLDLIPAGGSTTVQPTDVRGEDIASVAVAKQTFVGG